MVRTTLIEKEYWESKLRKVCRFTLNVEGRRSRSGRKRCPSPPPFSVALLMFKKRDLLEESFGGEDRLKWMVGIIHE